MSIAIFSTTMNQNHETDYSRRAKNLIREYDENFTRDKKVYKIKFRAIIPNNNLRERLTNACNSFYKAIKDAYKFKEPFISFDCHKCKVKINLKGKFMALHEAGVTLVSLTPNLNFTPRRYSPNSDKWLAPERIISLWWLDDRVNSDSCEHWNSPL